MFGDQNQLSKFWKELKRRRVIHVITLYASASFVIIELINNLAEPLNLPANLLTIVVIILAIGFPLAVILSWLFDLTSEGVEITKPLSEVEEGDKPSFSNAWKIATFVSFAVIIVLVVLNLTENLKQLKTGDIKSLVVLPFDNFTGDEKLDFYVDGMHDGLIGNIQKVSALRVISKTSSSTFKDSGMSIPDIAESLNVEAILETSVRCFGEDSICLQTRVISVYPEEKQLWVSDYKIHKSEILNTFSQITKQIADETMVELTTEEEAILSEYKLIDPDAYDDYLKGQYYWEMLDPDSIHHAMQSFERAVQKEPEWADPYVGLANTWLLYGNYGILSRSITIPNMLRNLGKAMELNPQSSQAHYGNAIYAVWTDWNWELGEEEFLKTIELNPNDALARLYYAHLLIILHRYDEAVNEADIGLALDPLRPLGLMLYNIVVTATGNYQTAITVFEKNNALGSKLASRGGALQAYYLTGDYERWIQNWEKKVKNGWNDTAIENVVNTMHEKGHIAAVEEMFKMNKKYGNGPGGALMINGIKARRALYLNKPEDALDYLENDVNSEGERLSGAYIGSDTYIYEKLKIYPRYVELLRIMNLPLPDIEDYTIL
jgi:adenylate cyclase